MCSNPGVLEEFKQREASIAELELQACLPPPPRTISRGLQQLFYDCRQQLRPTLSTWACMDDSVHKDKEGLLCCSLSTTI